MLMGSYVNFLSGCPPPSFPRAQLPDCEAYQGRLAIAMDMTAIALTLTLASTHGELRSPILAIR